MREQVGIHDLSFSNIIVVAPAEGPMMLVGRKHTTPSYFYMNYVFRWRGTAWTSLIQFLCNCSAMHAALNSVIGLYLPKLAYRLNLVQAIAEGR
jgi:hypothetical protein